MSTPTTREQAVALDRRDLLAGGRDHFVMPPGVIYLDGNSLGPPPRRTLKRVAEVLESEWGGGLIRSWNEHGWIDLPGRVARGIAPLIGARADEVMVADSTSVNLFKLIAAGLRLRPGRGVILSERENFPTDLYVAQGVADLLGDGVSLRLVDRAELVSAMTDDVAVVMLTHVDFRSGELHDLVARTAQAHEVGALMLWDLAHSAGAVPVDMAGCGADMAVGCGYKYLNGGPGAPAFVFVARRHHEKLQPPLWGWMGHEAPFEFSPRYRPAKGIGRLQVGTPPILGLAALECGVAGIAEIGVDRLRARAMEMTELFIELVARDCGGHGLELASPRNPARRGCQVALRHREGYAIVQALIDGGVIGDFRSPDLLRFGFAPSYIRFVDVWDAVRVLKGVMEERQWDRSEYKLRARVT